MTIREYFENLMAGALTVEEMDDLNEYEMTIYHCYEEDFDDFSMWAIENGIDIDATETVLHEEVLVLTLWAYDMCGD